MDSFQKARSQGAFLFSIQLDNTTFLHNMTEYNFSYHYYAVSSQNKILITGSKKETVQAQGFKETSSQRRKMNADDI